MNVKPFYAYRPKTSLITSGDVFISNIKKQYPNYFHNKLYERTSNPGLFIYRITKEDKTHLGLIGAVDIQDYIDGKILKHEDTLAYNEQKTTDLILQRGGVIKPVLLGHKPDSSLHNIYIKYIENYRKKPYIFHLEQENTTHELYLIQKEEIITEIGILMKKLENFYIADGHHRLASTKRLKMYEQDGDKNFDYLQSALFSFDELDIHEYNRVVDIRDLDPVYFTAKLSTVCRIEPVDAINPERKSTSTYLILKEKTYRLHFKELNQKNKNDIFLASQWLNEKVFREILNIPDVRNDDRIKYIEGTVGMDGIRSAMYPDGEIRNSLVAAFILPAVTKEEFISISNQRKTLPPKSTWFEPRLKNGIITQMFEDNVLDRS